MKKILCLLGLHKWKDQLVVVKELDHCYLGMQVPTCTQCGKQKDNYLKVAREVCK